MHLGSAQSMTHLPRAHVSKPGRHAKCYVYFFSVQGTTAMALISMRYSGFVNAETCTSVLAG